VVLLSPLLMSSMGLPCASAQAPRASNGGAHVIGGGGLSGAPTAAFVHRHEAGAPFTSVVSPPVEVQVGVRISVAVHSKGVVVCVPLLAPIGQRRRPVIFCHCSLPWPWWAHSCHQLKPAPMRSRTSSTAWQETNSGARRLPLTGRPSGHPPVSELTAYGHGACGA
jgi:hypothetical protein